MSEPNTQLFSQAQLLRDLYSSLPLPDAATYIRVLNLKVRSNRWTTKSSKSLEEAPLLTPELSGEIRVVDLDTHPRYTALSYVWGGEPQDRYILNCNGARISLTQNCYEALSNLIASEGDLTIWVDAVCINQSDVREKTKQIMLMGEIYSWALKTYIWLGPSDDRSDECMELRNRWLFYSIKGSIGFTPNRYLSLLRYRSLVLHPYQLVVRSVYEHILWVLPYINRSLGGGSDYDGGLAAAKSALKGFLDSDWTERLWTYQELALSGNPVLVRGRQVRPFEEFIWAFTESSPWIAYESPLIERWAQLVDTWMSIGRPVQWRGRRMRITSLMELFFGIMDKQASKISFATYKSRTGMLNRILIPFHTVLCWCLVMMLSPASNLNLIFGVIVFFEIWQFDEHLRSSITRTGPLSSESSMPAERTSHKAHVVRTVRLGKGRNAEDRSFAIRGILQDLGLPLLPLATDAPLSRIYRDLFCDLHRLHSLNGLVDAGLPAFPEAPTWTPRYDLAMSRSWINASYAHQPLAFPISSKRFSARVIEDRLLTSGAIVDEIVYRATELQKETNEGDHRYSTRIRTANIRGILDLIRTMRNDCEALPDALPLAQRILQITKARPSKHAPDAAVLAHHNPLQSPDHTPGQMPRWEPPRSVSDPAANINKWYRLLAEHCAAQIEDHYAANCLHLIDESPAMIETHKWIVDKLAEQRIMFLTRYGRLGTATTYARTGDKIVVIPTVAMPLILRPVDNATETFTVVGASFIAGMMDGERREADELRNITLI